MAAFRGELYHSSHPWVITWMSSALDCSKRYIPTSPLKPASAFSSEKLSCWPWTHCHNFPHDANATVDHLDWKIRKQFNNCAWKLLEDLCSCSLQTHSHKMMYIPVKLLKNLPQMFVLVIKVLKNLTWKHSASHDWLFTREKFLNIMHNWKWCLGI